MRKNRLITAVTAIILLAGALAAGWWYMGVGQYPLRGDTSHDLGTFAIVDGVGAGSHTFHLRNVSDRVIEIETVRTGCGCTSATTSTDRIEPGATLEVQATLELSRPKHKKTYVSLFYEGNEQRLWIEGTATVAASGDGGR